MIPFFVLVTCRGQPRIKCQHRSTPLTPTRGKECARQVAAKTRLRCEILAEAISSPFSAVWQ
jgi:hypothetical protein